MVANANTLPYGWVPSHRRPAQDLRRATQQIKDTWQEVLDDADEIKFYSKYMILALFGIMTTQKRTLLRAYCTENDEDVPGRVTIQTYQESRSLEFCTTDLLDTRTMLPIALQCKFNEVLLMEKAMRTLEKIPTTIPLAARVDGIYFAYEKRKYIAQS